LIAVFFVPYQLKRAAVALTVFLVIGFAVGWMQQLRGAHFLFHTLWSMWLSTVTVFVIQTAIDRWPVPNQAINPSAA